MFHLARSLVTPPMNRLPKNGDETKHSKKAMKQLKKKHLAVHKKNPLVTHATKLSLGCNAINHRNLICARQVASSQPAIRVY